MSVTGSVLFRSLWVTWHQNRCYLMALSGGYDLLCYPLYPSRYVTESSRFEGMLMDLLQAESHF
jgi:hypothetical protein